MANQIIKQPDGKFAIWSTVIDDFTHLDAMPEEIIALWTGEESIRIAGRVGQIVAELNKGGRPYHQFTMSWDEANAKRRTTHDAT